MRLVNEFQRRENRLNSLENRTRVHEWRVTNARLFRKKIINVVLSKTLLRQYNLCYYQGPGGGNLYVSKTSEICVYALIKLLYFFLNKKKTQKKNSISQEKKLFFISIIWKCLRAKKKCADSFFFIRCFRSINYVVKQKKKNKTGITNEHRAMIKYNVKYV